MTKDLQDFRDEITKEFAHENVHYQVGALKEHLAWTRWTQYMDQKYDRDNSNTLRFKNWKDIK